MSTETEELYRRSDGRFTVTGWKEWRHRSFSYRGRSRVRGDPSHRSFSARSESEILERCEGLWQAYLKGSILAEPKTRPLTLGEIVDAFLSRPGLTSKTKATYERVLRLLTDHNGRDLPHVAIGRRTVESWIERMTCGQVSKASYLRTARALFRHAVAEGWIETDPTAGISIEVKRMLRPWLRYPEWTPFLLACWPGHRIRAGFVLETGLRTGELMAARWSWLHDIDGRTAIRIAPDNDFTPKWAQSRAVPLSAKAVEWLEAAKAKWPTGPYIFTNDRLTGPKFARETASACKRSGVTQVDFHGLRRAAGARWLELGMPLHVVSRLLGHADITTTMRWYGGIADEHLAREMDRVDAAAGKPNKVRKLSRARPATATSKIDGS